MAHLFYKKIEAPIRYSKDGLRMFDMDRFEEDAKKRAALKYWEMYENICAQLGIDRII